MQSIYEPATLAGFTSRIGQLKPNSQRQWGKMNVAQMMAHCSITLEQCLGERTVPRTFLGRILGPLVKSSLTNDKPLKQNIPTDKSFIVSDDQNFETQRERFTKLLTRFSQKGADGMQGRAHPFFGKMSPEEWSSLQVKHTDHHLRQFGV